MSSSNAMVIAEPNPTLYVSNIDWKIKKAILRRALHTLFGRHGKVLEIITLRKEGLRGQAWVIFEDQMAATAAFQSENGFSFFGKDLKVAYAVEKSDRIAKRDGTYIPKDRRAAKKQRVSNKVDLKLETTNGNAQITSADIGNINTINNDSNTMSDNTNHESTLVKHEEEGADATIGVTSASTDDDKGDKKNSEDTTTEVPSNILFSQDVPPDCNEMMLAMLFRQYPGYKEVRIPRAGLAFVEFEDEPHATVALKALNGFKLTANDKLNLKYGKA